MPVIIGMIIAYVLNPLVDIVDKYIYKVIKKEAVSRAIAIFISMSLVLGIFIVLMVALIPELFQSIVTFIANIPDYKLSLYNFINSLAQNKQFVNLSQIDNIINKILDSITKYFSNEDADIVTTSLFAGKYVFNTVVGLILSIYMLASKKKIRHLLRRFAHRIFPDKKYLIVSDIWHACDDIITKFIWFDVLDAFIIGIINFIFMEIMGMPYAVLISFVVAVANLIPTFGPIIGGVVGAFVLLLADLDFVLVFLLFTIVLQTFDGYILKPKLFGGALGIESIWILISIVVGGRIFGIPGIILGVPFAAIINYLYKLFLKTRKKKDENGKNIIDEEKKEDNEDIEKDGE